VTIASGAAKATLRLGARVSCTDKPCGFVTSLVVDPMTRKLPYLVVEPTGRLGLGKLVPIGAARVKGRSVEIGFERSEFEALPSAERTRFKLGLPISYGQSLRRYPEANVSDVLPPGLMGLRRATVVRDYEDSQATFTGLIIDTFTTNILVVIVSKRRFLYKRTLLLDIGGIMALGDEVTLPVPFDKAPLAQR
jgi:hypothetical protein